LPSTATGRWRPGDREAFGMIDEQMRAMLMVAARAGILVGIKGPNGGHRLARPAEKITLLEIIEAASGKRGFPAESLESCSILRRRRLCLSASRKAWMAPSWRPALASGSARIWKIASINGRRFSTGTFQPRRMARARRCRSETDASAHENNSPLPRVDLPESSGS
jgi:hypothetical protein